MCARASTTPTGGPCSTTSCSRTPTGWRPTCTRARAGRSRGRSASSRRCWAVRPRLSAISRPLSQLNVATEASPWAAHSRLELANVLVGIGDHAGAHDLLEEARATARTLGMQDRGGSRSRDACVGLRTSPWAVREQPSVCARMPYRATGSQTPSRFALVACRSAWRAG